MMCGWPNQSNAAGWRTHIRSRAFARSNASKGCSVTRKRDSSPLFAGEKNGLWPLRYRTPRVVRPKAAASSGFALRRSPYLPRVGGASGRLQTVRRGEARAVGLSGRECAAHEALRPVCRPALPKWHHQGRGRGAAPGLADGQAPRDGLHARTDPARGNPGAEGHWNRQIRSARATPTGSWSAIWRN